MSTQVTVNNTDTAGTPPVALHQVEARENRIQRLSTGVLLTVIGLLLVWALWKPTLIATVCVLFVLALIFDRDSLAALPL